MNNFLSTYMNALRLVAAAVVFLTHYAYGTFTRGAVPTFGHNGHSAVIVFFVLSGFVITYVASEREPSLRHFVASRAARIYSVALPALALTSAVDLLLFANGNPLNVNP